MKLKVSVIIPIYNCEKYLTKCLDSLINQTYSNLEIILINDGSTDDSLNICNSFKKKYKNVVVVNKKNSGVSAARNDGLKKASGDYIMFVDADDWLDSNCLEICINYIKEYNVDIVMFPYIREYNNKSILRKLYKTDKLFEDKIEVEKEILSSLIGPSENEISDPTNMERLNSVWGKLYKKDLVKKVKFIDFNKTIGEDLLYNLEIFNDANNSYYTEKTCYHYNKTNYNSITKNSPTNIMERWDFMYFNISNMIKKVEFDSLKKVELMERLERRIAINLLSVIQQFYNTKTKFFKKYMLIRKLLNEEKYIKSIKRIKIESMNLKWKIYFYCCKYKLVLPLMIMSSAINYIKRSG